MQDLNGTWEGIAYLAAAKCKDAAGKTLLCCIEDLDQPISVGVKLTWRQSADGGRLDYEYTTVINQAMSYGAFVYQPTFAWTTEVQEVRRLKDSMLVRTALTIDSSACLYAYYDRHTPDNMSIAVQTRQNYLSGSWSQEYWCGLVAPRPVNGGCTPGSVWPSANMSDVGTSWWHTSHLQLTRLQNSSVQTTTTQVTCTCTTPNQGTEGKNGYQCNDSTSGWCANTEPCSATTSFPKGDWSKGCGPPVQEKLEDRKLVQLLVPIIGVSAGVAAILSIMIIIYFVWRRRRKRSEQIKHGPELVTPDANVGTVQAEADAEAQHAGPSTVENSVNSVGASMTEPTNESDTKTWGLVQILGSGLREHWLLEAGDIQIEETIKGMGGFGIVRKGVLLDATAVAVKTCIVGNNASKNGAALANEMRLLRRVRHPNIVLFFGVHVCEGTIGLVLEWVEGVNLKQYVQEAMNAANESMSASSSQSSKMVSLGHRPKLLLDVSSGMQFLHAQRPPIIHRDLKPSNVLVELIATPPRAKITDFGLSVILQGSDVQGVAGTKMYMAPEVVAGMPSNSSADVYSFGCTACFTFTGQNAQQLELKQVIWSAMIDAEVPEPTLSGIAACLHEDPTSRPTFTQVRSSLTQWVQILGFSNDASSLGSLPTSTTRSTALKVSL